MSFVLKQYEIGPMQNFGYLIGDQKSKQAVVVDPAWEAGKIVSTVDKEGFKLAGLAVSHAHYDHTNAILELLKKFDVPVYANKEEVPYSQIGAPLVCSLGSTLKPVEGNDVVKLGETEITFLHTPGHTPGSQCIQVGDNLITGDTLFIGGCGRADLPGGDGATLFKSLKKIASLPSHLTIWPGHDYGMDKNRKLEQECEENPYLGMESQDQFLKTVS